MALRALVDSETGAVVALVDGPTGDCRYSHHTTTDELHAGRPLRLVNARDGWVTSHEPSIQEALTIPKYAIKIGFDPIRGPEYLIRTTDDYLI